MTSPENIRRAIQENFNYLITSFGFVEVLNFKTDKIYSEVRYKKNEWTISIVTTAHGTKISLSILSPTDDFGFLGHYFETIDNQYYEKNNTKELAENIAFNSDFLKLNGAEVLEANHLKLTKILDIVKSKQDAWVKPLTRKQ